MNFDKYGKAGLHIGEGVVECENCGMKKHTVALFDVSEISSLHQYDVSSRCCENPNYHYVMMSMIEF